MTLDECGWLVINGSRPILGLERSAAGQRDEINRGRSARDTRPAHAWWRVPAPPSKRAARGFAALSDAAKLGLPQHPTRVVPRRPDAGLCFRYVLTPTRFAASCGTTD